MAPYHHIMAHFPMGLLFVSFFIILARAFSDSERTRGFDRLLPVLLVAGLLGGVGTFLTGLLIWPSDAVVASPMGRNKVLFAIWAMAAWALVAALRIRGGEQVWQGSRRLPLLFFTLVAAFLLAVTGTLGGYLLGSPSDFSLGLKAAGWDVYHTFYAPTWALGVGVAAALVIAVLGVLGARQKS
ncbi:DUF2231 domain-containing protein [Pseudothauera rhizosphaerae]|uniref:Heme ABC transporter permease n=1 Tax=Pseudothauera rhizosphaerae TaxID=2565932 RepID=A0A4S4ARC7_9RHOO|nr:DUF2231 domain-containing protein [Pseudothauera rhizosphaerae]THF61026.1 heme ABC transporter permease [Pseudothauera rhizosphaerae]